MSKKSKGLTLMEITIVLAIMVIVALILVPVFLLTTDRARLRADIQSARIIQNAIDLYRIERGQPVEGFPNDVEEMIDNLAYANYLNRRNVNIQTADAEWFFYTNFGVIVDISDSPDEVYEAYLSLPDDEKRYVRSGR